MSESLHPNAPHHLPSFITAPGDTDVLIVAVGIFLIVAILAVGNFGLHVVDATGLVHAMLLRIQALLLPIKTLVLSGH